jgi:hypothetical protein
MQCSQQERQGQSCCVRAHYVQAEVHLHPASLRVLQLAVPLLVVLETVHHALAGRAVRVSSV